MLHITDAAPRHGQNNPGEDYPGLDRAVAKELVPKVAASMLEHFWSLQFKRGKQ